MKSMWFSTDLGWNILLIIWFDNFIFGWVSCNKAQFIVSKFIFTTQRILDIKNIELYFVH